MIIVVIVLIIAIGLLWSEYNAKTRYIKIVEDAITIADQSTEFLFRLRQVSIINKETLSARLPVDFDTAEKLLRFIANNRYYQTYCDVETFNSLGKYRGLALLDYVKLQNIIDGVNDGKYRKPGDIDGWHELIKKHSKS